MNEAPIQWIVIAGALVSLVMLWKISTRKRRRRSDAAPPNIRLLSLFGRVALTTVVIVGIQWAVVAAAADNRGLVLAVLGVPASLAAYAVTKALTVTAVDTPRSRGVRR